MLGLEMQLESVNGSIKRAQSSAVVSAKAREEAEVAQEAAENDREDLRAELKCLEAQQARLVETSEWQHQELLQREEQWNAQCEAFKEIYDCLFSMARTPGITLSGSLRFPVGDVGSYASFLQGFVTKLKEVATDFHQTIGSECRELGT